MLARAQAWHPTFKRSRSTTKGTPTTGWVGGGPGATRPICLTPFADGDTILIESTRPDERAIYSDLLCDKIHKVRTFGVASIHGTSRSAHLSCSPSAPPAWPVGTAGCQRAWSDPQEQPGQGNAVRKRHGPDSRHPAAVRRAVPSGGDRVSGVRRRIAVPLSLGGGQPRIPRGHRSRPVAASGWVASRGLVFGEAMVVHRCCWRLGFVYAWRKGVFRWR